jgi:glycosyltransferase involved in cell wall biosynthesis
MTRALSILYVAYPLLAATEESAGGAEQMLLALEREMNARGHRTTVAAAEGSRVSGRLLATGAPAGRADEYDIREREHTRSVLAYLASHSGEFDLIHDESGSFFRRASECPLPMLATLHLPRTFYPREWFGDASQFCGQPRGANLGHRAFTELASNLSFNCVSQSQARSFGDCGQIIGVVENGIVTEQFPLTRDKEDYVLWLGRICEEKAPHLAITAAQEAALPLVIAGQVYPFSYHQAYFEREVRPHLNGRSRVRFVDTPLASQKLKLLRHARALLLTSTVEETSSLVAMEAMASGTPVAALRRGAFPEIVADGDTGFLVDTIEQMASALEAVDRLSPEKCRARVERHFSASRMAQEYEELYRRVLTSTKKLAA